MRVARSHQEDFVGLVSNRKFKEALSFLEKGFDINKPLDGETPLHHLTSNSISGVHWLLDHGANIDAISKNGLTPLMVACVTGGKRGSQIAKSLIQRGANIMYRRQTDGMSALEFAVKNCTPEIVADLVNSGLQVNGPNGRKQTPAMLAARANNVETLKVLVNLGANLTISCKLPWAEGMTCREIAHLEKRQRVLKYLDSL